MQPRWYQQDLIDRTRRAWSAGAQNVLVVSPPRSGKTPTAVWLSEPFIASRKHVCFQVHREELIKQIAHTFAAFGYDHNVIAPSDVVQAIIHKQVQKYGHHFVRPGAYATVGSVQTILSRASKMSQWASDVRLWITDEAHHCAAGSIWDRVIEMFPRAYGLGFTATPARPDRKPLARSQGGVFDAMVKGVTARQLIDEGHICDYRLIAPAASIDRDSIKIGSTGDYTQKGLSQVRKRSTITGDAVASYKQFVDGKQAVVFAVDIEHARELTDAYRAAGVSAEMVSGKTPKGTRKHLMDKFERAVFNVLVNVDLFGEGLNIEGISVVIMARPTESFVLYTQQFFRALTATDGKHQGTIIDHVGNVKRHGLPDAYNGWTLEIEDRRRSKRNDDEEKPIPVTRCTECFKEYEALTPQCPFCGHRPEPVGRARPEQVDGDLIELDPETLRMMRGEIKRIDAKPQVPQNLSGPAVSALKRNWRERQEAQADLRHAIAVWAGTWRDRGDDDHAIYRRFWHTFGTDVMTAQTLSASDALALMERIRCHDTH